MGYGRKILWSLLLLIVCSLFFYFLFINSSYISYSSGSSAISSISDSSQTLNSENIEEDAFKPVYLKTPEQVKALYMTSWIAGTPSLREALVKIVEDTELNSMVIDIKDDTGRISFEVYDPFLKEIGSQELRISDLREFINDLNKKGIYVIGRVSVFQDPFLVGQKPELAVKNETDRLVWKDKKGLSWVDPGSKDVWNYVVAIAKEAHKAGFDEINFDYIRFPSDGNMRDIYYPWSEGREKREIMKEFFSYLNKNLKEDGIVMSVDIFGMVTTNYDDLNIGQYLEDFFPYFDFIAPMVYPSHYPDTWHGFANPAEYPYDVIKISMSSAVNRLKVYNDTVASTTVKLRPWLQDFDLGATYTPQMIRSEIQATYDSGLDSWMIWNASNRYTAGALNAQ